MLATEDTNVTITIFILIIIIMIIMIIDGGAVVMVPCYRAA